MESFLLPDLASYWVGDRWGYRYQVGLTFAFNETEVLGDAPDTNSIIVQLVEEEAEVRKGERTYPSSPGDSTGCLACHLPGSSPSSVLKCHQLARVSAPQLHKGKFKG